ncbi:zinc finger protein 511 isoform X2 [Salminus brasiliensis]|uniref:zinc finger protein 511 isoform X2 n=1 Tax=Salminus brasiliensis TaxID=930266 RepID=UPI003B82D511
MLHPSLLRLLDGSDATRINIHTVPIIEKSEILSGNGGERAEGTDSPFRFTPHSLHLHKDDELFEDGDVHRHLYLQDLVTTLTDEPQAPHVSEFRCHITGCKQLFDTLEGYEHHYNSLHRHVCSNCKRSFPSNRLLDIHILEWHDSLFQVMAEKQCMYQCLVEGCGLKFQTSKERKDHLITAHSYPSDFRFDRSKKMKRTKEKRAPQQRKDCMAVSGRVVSQHGEAENCESMDISLPQESERQEFAPSQQTKPRYTYKVPSSICFGQGSVRGFRGGRKKK